MGSVINDVEEAFVDAANTVADGVVDTANTVADGASNCWGGVTDVANETARLAQEAANAVVACSLPQLG